MGDQALRADLPTSRDARPHHRGSRPASRFGGTSPTARRRRDWVPSADGYVRGKPRKRAIAAAEGSSQPTHRLMRTRWTGDQLPARITRGAGGGSIVGTTACTSERVAAGSASCANACQRVNQIGTLSGRRRTRHHARLPLHISHRPATGDTTMLTSRWRRTGADQDRAPARSDRAGTASSCGSRRSWTARGAGRRLPVRRGRPGLMSRQAAGPASGAEARRRPRRSARRPARGHAVPASAGLSAHFGRFGIAGPAQPGGRAPGSRAGARARGVCAGASRLPGEGFLRSAGDRRLRRAGAGAAVRVGGRQARLAIRRTRGGRRGPAALRCPARPSCGPRSAAEVRAAGRPAQGQPGRPGGQLWETKSVPRTARP